MEHHDPRCMIVNADDFGISAGVNQGIIMAHERGIVTSTSLMVRQPAACEAAAYSRVHPEFSVGLHLDLCEWVYENEIWRPRYEVVQMGDASIVRDEVLRQLARFRELVGREPTHVDSHQHVHRAEPVRAAALEIAGMLGVALRHVSPDLRYCGDFYGQTGQGYPCHEAITVDRLIDIVRSLPPGVTELSCHPGLNDDVDSVYQRERSIEVRVLCDPQVRTFIAAERVTLCSFGRLPGDVSGPVMAPGVR